MQKGQEESQIGCMSSVLESHGKGEKYIFKGVGEGGFDFGLIYSKTPALRFS